MSESAARPHPSSLTLDAIALGAPVVDETRVRDHLAACEVCREELAARRGEAEEFLGSIFSRSLPRIRERVGARPAVWRLFPLAAAVPAAAALALWWAALRSGPPPAASPGAPGAPGAIGVKGGPSFRVFALHGGSVSAVRDGAVLSPADRIRFAVAPEGSPYLLIASIDGSGAATIYYPYGGERSAPVEAGALVELPGSIQLDDARGPERVYALFSRAPIPAAVVLERLRAIGAGGGSSIRAATTLDVAADHQASVLFERAP